MYDEERDSNLLEDVRKFIKNKMWNIKSVDEIPLHVYKLKKGMSGNESDLHAELCFLKKVLQITINVYNKYDTYKGFVFKFLKIEKKQRLFLEDYCEYDEKKDVWKCKSRPKESNLEEALYNYIYCFLSIQMKKKVYYKGERNRIFQCTICDNDISQNEDRCEICDTSISEMEFTKEHQNNEEINSREKNLNKDIPTNIYDDFFTNEIIVSDKNDNFKAEVNEEKNSKFGQKIKYVDKHNLDKWKCGGCEFLNEYTFINCEVCEGLYKDGKWNCGSCMMENSCIDNKCEACGEENNNMKTEDKENDDKYDSIKNDLKIIQANNREIEENITSDKWKCGKCECLNEYTFGNCKVCCGSYRHGKWNCGKCTMENSCFNSRCSECWEKNINVKNAKKINDEISDSIKIINELKINNKKHEEKTSNDKWKCEKCSLKNSCVNDKCEGCNKNSVNIIDRGSIWYKDSVNDKDKFNSLKKEIDKKKSIADKEIGFRQWKCERCGILNLYYLMVCGECKGRRQEYGLWRCTQCTMINKCGDVECTVCGVMNDNLLIKHCKYCKKNELKGGEIQCGECIKNKCNTWKCPFAHCGELNVEKDDYCQKCQIYYYSSQSRGMPVKVYNQELYMWICIKCYKYNKMNSNVCECGKKRLKKGMIEKFCDILI